MSEDVRLLSAHRADRGPEPNARSACEPISATPDLILAFARAISRDALAHVLNENNERRGRCSLRDAAEARLPFYVHLQADVLAIDGDENLAAVWAFADKLSSEGFQPVVVASGRPDHMHLLVRVAVAYREIRNEARTAGLDVRDAIRPPLSPHRLPSLVPQLLRPAGAEEALSALAREPRRLGRRIHRLLREGSDDRSAAIQSIALASVNAGWTFENFEDEVRRSPLATKFSGRTDSWAYLRRSYEKAVELFRNSPALPKADVREQIRAAAKWQEVNHPWPRGRCLCVYLSHIVSALAAGSLEYGSSVRDRALKAGITSLSTVGKWDAYLVRQGLIRVVARARPGRGMDASIWRLVVHESAPEDEQSSLTRGREGSVSNGVQGIFNADVFRGASSPTGGRGLPFNAARLVSSLEHEPAASLAVLAKRLRLHRNTVGRLVRAAAALDLVVVRDRKVMRGPATLAEAAARAGVQGAEARQRARYDDERTLYRRKLCGSGPSE